MTAAEQNTAALVRLLASWTYVDNARKNRPETSALAYAQAALRQECAAVAGTPVGTGLNDRLAASAFSIGTLVQPGGLTHEEAFSAIYQAALQAGANDPPKDRSTIERQLREGEKHPRDLAQTNGHRNGKAVPGTHTIRVSIEASETISEASTRIEPFPLEVLPSELRRFVTEGADSLCCPPDYLAIPMLCSAAAAIGASRALKLTPDWWVFSSLYAAVVAPPSSAKSPAAARVLAATKYRQLHNFAQYKKDKADWTKGDMDAPVADPPKFVRTYTTDVTTEKLASLLADCPRGLLYHRDELVAWIASFNQYRDGGKGADQQAFMSMWDHQSLSIERKSHDDGLPITVQRPCLTVFGTIQPDKLSQLTSADDGFIERILFSFPETLEVRKWSWEGISSEARKLWREIAGKLYSLEMGEPLEEGDDPWPRFVTFAPEARPVWESWYTQHQRLRRSLPETMHACHAKLESYAARLALLLEMLWYASGSPVFNPAGSPDVSPDAVEFAGRLVTYFLAHARKAYGCLELTPGDKRADRVISWIRKQGGCTVPRDLQRSHVGGVRKASEALRLLEDLADRGLGTITVEKSSNGHDVVRFTLPPVAGSLVVDFIGR